MAASSAALATGEDDGDIRRRNVQSYEKANGGTVYKVEAEDTKKLHKVGLPVQSLSRTTFGPAADSTTAEIRRR